MTLDFPTLNAIRDRLHDRVAELDYEAKTLGASPAVGARIIQQVEINRILATIIDPLIEQAQQEQTVPQPPTAGTTTPKPSDIKGKTK
ncbi:hypothetical protein [Bifidobacterium animalis]|uniref:hypothetical protein n=1 Tax=Bifidobacterium animalis TaxID=28025 RepID=UPI003F8E1818